MCKEVSSAPLSHTATKCGQVSLTSTYATLGATIAIFAVWAKLTFVQESDSVPAVHVPVHSYYVPLLSTIAYLVGIPLLRIIVDKHLLSKYDTKAMLMPSMIFYNIAQVFVNVWMVYRLLRAVLVEGHPFIGNITARTTTYVVWVHYTNKYLEFMDTVFMVLRGKMNQVSFLHMYHHATIAWAWWIALFCFPGGDSYFGALMNSGIHVLMYSYYALSLLKIKCPWKKFLTQAQLLQFATVVVYTFFSSRRWPAEDRTIYCEIAMFVQVWEMTSLFLLFMLFYRKSYSKKKAQNSKKEDGQNASVGATVSITKAATAALDAATEDASKIVCSASKVPPVKKVVGATSRPSWSIVN